MEDTSPTIRDNRITGNSAGRYGGGIDCFWSSPTITGNEIRNNGARCGGAVACSSSSGVITGNTLAGNTAAEHGGGISSDESTPDIRDNDIVGNTAGGAGGGISLSVESSSAITGNEITGNSAGDWGGGIGCGESSETASKNTITATNPDGRGILSSGPSCPHIKNCIMWGNEARTGSQIHSESSEATPALSYTDIQGGVPAGCVDGGYNIDVDPQFVALGHWDDNGTPVDPSDDVWVGGDYHLKSMAGHWTSGGWVNDAVSCPCIDAGDPSDPVGDEQSPNGNRINMGAYGGTEWASKSPRVLTATVQLEGYIGSPGAVLPLEFVFTDAAGAEVGRVQVDVPYTNGLDTETVVLQGVPLQAVNVSCKETLHFLRRRVPIGGTAPNLTADFTGDSKLLGGDINRDVDNFVELGDFAQFLREFGRADRPESDINGDGVVDILEFGYIGLHFFQGGDPE